MYWDEELKRDLRLYGNCDIAVLNLKNKIKELEKDFASVNSALGSSTPVKGGGNGAENKFLDYITRKGKLENQLAAVEYRQAIMQTALDRLTPEEKTVLVEFFVKRQKGRAAIVQLQDALNYSQSTLYAIRDKALKHLTDVLYSSQSD